MPNLRPILASSKANTISQERLETLRDLRQKRDELQKLEACIARQVMDEMRLGSVPEAGRWQAKITSRQVGSKRIHELVVY